MRDMQGKFVMLVKFRSLSVTEHDWSGEKGLVKQLFNRKAVSLPSAVNPRIVPARPELARLPSLAYFSKVKENYKGILFREKINGGRCPIKRTCPSPFSVEDSSGIRERLSCVL